ncbi:hypothetical protein G6F68_014561 [Rhizopus microsporus]|nr:hypothetical protein G6F68_014561 [Rhizopus microsporus]
MVAGGEQMAVGGRQVALVGGDHQHLPATIAACVRIVGTGQVALRRRELRQRVRRGEEGIALGRIGAGLATGLLRVHADLLRGT